MPTLPDDCFQTLLINHTHVSLPGVGAGALVVKGVLREGLEAGKELLIRHLLHAASLLHAATAAAASAESAKQ